MQNYYKINRFRSVLFRLFGFVAFSIPVMLLAQLNGTYTLGPGGDFTTFNAFVSSLTSNGVGGPVTLNVASGQTFTEQVTIPQIASMNTTNTVTVNGNGSTLQFTATSSTARHTLWLNGADYFTFDNLKIAGLHATWIYTVRLSNQANYNVFYQCELSAPNANYTSAVMSSFTATFPNTGNASAVVAYTSSTSSLSNRSTGTNGRGNRFEECLITGPSDNSSLRGPSYGIFEQGTSGTSTGQNEYINNTIKNFTGAGYYSWYSSSNKIIGNTVTRKLNSAPVPNGSIAYLYGIFTNYPFTTQHNEDYIVEGNRVEGIGNDQGTQNSHYFYGITSSYHNGTSSAQNISTRFRIERNFIGNNYYGNPSYSYGYLYGLTLYYAARSEAHNNVVTNNKPINVNGYRYNYDRSLYAYYSKGIKITHNTLYQEFTLPTNTYLYNYSPYVFDCCAANTSNNDWEKIIFNNNVVYDDINTSNSNAYHYLYNYFYYITEIKNNAFYSARNNNNTDLYYLCRVGNSTSCVAGSNTLPNVNDGVNIVDNIKADPQFVDANNNNFAFTNPLLNASALPTGLASDFNGDSRNLNFPDRGAIEVTFDYAISGTFQGGSTVCGSYEENIKATVQNLMPFPLSNPSIGYILNDKPPRFQQGGNLAANGSLEITFDDPLQFFGEPTNSVLKVFIAHADDNNANDTLYFNITVLRAPYGSNLIPNLTTQARLSDFPMITPDISIPGEVVEFEVTAPAIYTNIGYGSGSDWTASVNAFVVGTNAPAAGLSWTPPSGGNNGVWSYDPQFVNENDIIEIHLVISDLNNFCDSTIKRRVLVAPTGSAQFKLPAQICLGEEIEFENESDVSSGFLYYEWDFGNGQTSDATNGKTVYNTPGSYDVTLYNITEPNGFVTSNTITITVTEAPVPNFDFVNKCYGTPVEFSNSSTVGSGTVGGTTWDFGDGNTDAGENTTHMYAVEGLYPVTMVTEANGCVKSITKNIVQFAQPTADFTLQSGSCQYGEFKFNNNSSVEFGFIGYTWKFGENGSLSTANNPTHKYQTAGSKEVTLIATTALGCTDSTKQVINVQPGPSADFTLSNECQHKDITFTSTDMVPGGVNALYNWNLAEGGNAMTSTAIVSYAWPGERTISLQVEYDNGCQNTVSKQVNILPTPIANFELVNSCAGDEIQFANTTSSSTGTLAYSWNFGDGNNSSDAKPTHTYSTNTDATYDVELTATVVDGCSDMISKTIEIYAKPITCDFVAEHSGANGFRNFKFEPTDGTNVGAQSGVTYNWYFGDGSSITDQSIAEHNFMQDGTYEVTMVASNDNDCECRMTKSVSIDMVGVVEINSNQSFIVYPNPNTGSFNINLNGFTGKTQIEVLTISGQSIFVNEIEGLFTTIDLGKVSTGMYLVKITNNGQSTMTKVQVTNN